MHTTAAEPRVLVVDDDPAWVELLGHALREVLPAAVVVAADGGDAALDLLATEQVDLVLLDLDMPGVDGREVLSRLSASEPAPQVVVVSGSSRGRDVELCRQLATGHVAKPDSLDDLVAVLRRIVAPGAPEPVPPTRLVVVGACELPTEGLQVRTVPTAAALVDGDLVRWADCAVVTHAADLAAVRAGGVPAVLVVTREADAPTGEHDVLPRAELTPSSLRRAVRHAVERVAFGALLVHQAQHDPLTALPTRTRLVERIGAALEGAERHGTVVGVVVVDLEGFGSVNDRFGREAGDQALVAVGDRLRSAVRPSDTVARIGGSRFAICCDSLDDPAVTDAVAVRVAWSLHAPVDVVVGGERAGVAVKAAVGTSTTAAVAADAEALLEAATRAASPRPVARGRDAEARLADALDELDTLTYVVSHDLRSPLGSLGSLLDLLEREYGGELVGEGRDWVALMRSGIGRMAGVLDGLVAYRRASAVVASSSSVDLHAVARAALDRLAPAVRASGATVTLSRLPVVVGDADLLGDLLGRVLENALRFVPAGAVPAIRLGAERQGDEWVLHVDDAGIGVPAEHRSRVLELFARMHGTDDFPGAGVGLAVASRLAERMGGRLWLDDAPGGAGCRVCLSLPAAD